MRLIILAIRKQASPILGVGDKIGEGDSSIILNVLPPKLSETAFTQMMDEVDWNVMYHRGKSSCQQLGTSVD
jgi:hypothetical protein